MNLSVYQPSYYTQTVKKKKRLNNVQLCNLVITQMQNLFLYCVSTVSLSYSLTVFLPLSLSLSFSRVLCYSWGF